MYILTFDTSSKSDSCAIYGPKGEIISVQQEQCDKQSEFIMDMIDEAIKQSGIDKNQISSIGVCEGPGSFTGARIGVATALALGQGWNIPVFGINSFEILGFENDLMPIIARKDNVFFYSDGLQSMKKEQFLSKFPNIGYKTFKEYEFNIDNIQYFNEKLTKASVIAKILLKDLKTVGRGINPLYFI